MSNLFLLGEQWKKYNLFADKKYNSIKSNLKKIKSINGTSIWGENKKILPWYERRKKDE